MMLDKTRQYGEVHGGNTGARYEQDGKLFDVFGKEMGESIEDRPNIEESQAPAIEPPRRGRRPKK